MDRIQTSERIVTVGVIVPLSRVVGLSLNPALNRVSS